MDPQTVALVVGAGGLTGFLPVLIKGLHDWRTGEHAREKEINQDALTQRDNAVRARDREIAYRIAWQDYATTVRILAREAGVTLEQLPTAPKSPHDRSVT